MKLSVRNRTLTTLLAASVCTSVLVTASAQASGSALGTQNLAVTSQELAAVATPVSFLDPTAAVATDCEAKVGYAINTVLPGLLVPDEQLGTVCLPFKQTTPAPAGYEGDYRVNEFSFAKAKEKLTECKAQASCPAVETAKSYVGSQFRATGTVSAVGKIDPLAADVDLNQIRRPVFFGQDPYNEQIAKANSRTYIFEMTAPADLYDQENRDAGPTTKLRGWYMKGAGVQTSNGSHKRALAIFIGGRSIETTAIHDPRDPKIVQDSAGKYYKPTYPNATTEIWGTRSWRQYLYSLNQAGFDVLTFDKRGHGISGGLTGDNVLNQGLDMLRAIDTLGSGTGLRVSGPSGGIISGKKAAEALIGDRSRAETMPIILGGPSQGSYVTETAMNANFNKWCSYDTPGEPCHKALGHKNVKGAVLLANLWGQPFIENADLALVAANAELNHFWFRPTSEPLANIGSWPAVFFGKGIWDENGQTVGVFDAYLRAKPGHRQLEYVRGPHSENGHGPANVEYMQKKVVEFATRTVSGKQPTQETFKTLQQALAASPPIWEVTTQPGIQQR